MAGGTLAVGALSFALPRFALGPGAQGLLLVGAMAAITLGIGDITRAAPLVRALTGVVVAGVPMRLFDCSETMRARGGAP